MANHSSILAIRTPWTVKKICHQNMSPPGRKVSNMLLGKGGGLLLIAPDESDGPKWKCLVVDVSGGENKVWCYKEQYCIGTWNVRFMNRDKLKVVKQEMARVNINILGISELKWTGLGEFKSDDHYIYYRGQESLRRNGVGPIVNKSPKSSTWV